MTSSDNNKVTVSGVFEPNERGGGFLRSVAAGYLASSRDVLVPEPIRRKFHLRGGELVQGEVQTKSGRNQPPRQELFDILLLEERPADERMEVKPFEELTAIDPERALRFSTPGGPVSMRVIDLMTPIGLGQRGLIVAPPRTGKTVLLHQMAHGVAVNHPDVYMMVLLIDERPEEVTEMKRTVHGEVIASSNDQDTASHVRLARLMIERTKRLVENGRDVVMLLDSLTRVGRAFNAFIRGSGRIMSGGLDIRALTEPKAIFGAARNAEHGGSLTIIASALIETGSRMDEVIFNEFKGTGNMEIMLSRELANRRVWPAIDLNQSGTRKEERLLSPKELEVSHHIRRNLLSKGPERSMQILVEALSKHPDNETFINNFSDRMFR